MSISFRNPIVPGFSPDPSIVCVEKKYFLVTSSFHVFPGIPVYASDNLKSWTHIGNAINRPSQLNLNKSLTLKGNIDNGSDIVATTGVWAPSIRYHSGKFYIISTNTSIDIINNEKKVNSENFYISTDDIWSDKWSDPIYYDWDGIDPSLFFDDDGSAYIQGQWNIGPRGTQPTGTIKQVKIDISTGKFLTEVKEIWRGWNKVDTEGPHIYKKDGWYYLVVAEGGTFQHHMLSIARSRDIWGPYEPYENNPILTADGTDEYIQNAGHGDIFQDAEGQWWSVNLAIRRGADRRNTMGRETFLTPVEWPKDGWPNVSQPKIEMSRDSKVLALPDLEWKQSPSIDLVYLRNNIADNYTVSQDHRNFKLAASEADFSSAVFGTCTFVGRRQRSLDSVVSVMLTIPQNSGQNLDAGLAVFKDQYRHAEIFYSAEKKRIILSWVDWRSGNTEVRESTEVDSGEVQFKIESTENKYSYFSRLVGSEWVKAGEVDTLALTVHDFTGPIFGVFAFGEGEANFENWSCAGNPSSS